MKPKELMTPEELEAYYVARRKAMLAGDEGVLPDGRTVREAREHYAEVCADDPLRTMPDITTQVMGESELPKMVATPESEFKVFDEKANKKCC